MSSGPLSSEQARIALAQRIVKRLAAVVALTLLTAAVFGLYTCVTDRPAREIFFEPRPEAPSPE